MKISDMLRRMAITVPALIIFLVIGRLSGLGMQITSFRRALLYAVCVASVTFLVFVVKHFPGRVRHAEGDPESVGNNAKGPR
jgi:hypothetical protein